MKYTPKERMQIKRRALRAVGKNSKNDKDDFMEECMEEVGDEDMCEILWEEEGGDN